MTAQHLKRAVENSQAISSTLVESDGFGERLKEAFGTDKPAAIAKKLDISYQGAKNYLEGRVPSAESLIVISRSTGYSIHWLLTGQGERTVHTVFNSRRSAVEERAEPLVIELPAPDRQALERLVAATGASAREEIVRLVHEFLIAKGVLTEESQPSNLVFFGEYTSMIELPMMGEISAGGAIEAVPVNETVLVPDIFKPKPGQRYMVLRVRGDSMNGDDIRDGSYIICEVRHEASNGEIVAALIDGQNVTVKRFYREGSRIRLQPANPEHTPVFIDESQRLEIQGVVVGMWRPSQLAK